MIAALANKHLQQTVAFGRRKLLPLAPAAEVQHRWTDEMGRTRLQQNKLANLRRTLDGLSSADLQRRYKANVPFVHVPIELLEQWGDNIRMLHDVPWFMSLFSHDASAAMQDFDQHVSRVVAELGEPLLDVPEMLELEPWRDLMSRAADLRRRLVETNTLTSDAVHS